MGQHTLRRSTGASLTAGRVVFSSAAALALLSGGAGMAFAGESSDLSSSSDHDMGEKDGHGKGHDKGDDEDHGKGDHHKGGHHHGTKHEHPESCEIPIYANLVEDVDALDEDLTDDATKAANEASAAAAKPAEDAVCPIIASELNDLDDELGEGPKDDYKLLGTSPTGLPDPHHS